MWKVPGLRLIWRGPGTFHILVFLYIHLENRYNEIWSNLMAKR